MVKRDNNNIEFYGQNTSIPAFYLELFFLYFLWLNLFSVHLVHNEREVVLWWLIGKHDAWSEREGQGKEVQGRDTEQNCESVSL